MDLKALRYFQAVAEFGSYSRGAAFLRISQPAVSRQILALEQELGRPLFHRHSHGVSLTEAGRILLERGQVALRQIDGLRDDIRRGDDAPSGTVTLAVPPAAGTVLMPELARRFADRFPNVFLRVVAGFSVYLQEWMLRGRVDVACLHDPAPQPGFTLQPLLSEEVVLVGRAGSLDLPRPYARPQDLVGLPLILPGRPNASRRLLDEWLARHQSRLHLRMEANDHLVIRALLLEGIGFSLLTRGALLPGQLQAGQLQAWPLRPRAAWTLCLMQQPEDRRSAAAAALADMVTGVVQDLLAENRWPGGTAMPPPGR